MDEKPKRRGFQFRLWVWFALVVLLACGFTAWGWWSLPPQVVDPEFASYARAHQAALSKVSAQMPAELAKNEKEQADWEAEYRSLLERVESDQERADLARRDARLGEDWEYHRRALKDELELLRERAPKLARP